MSDLFEVVISHNSQEKRLFTTASNEKEAGDKFNRYLACQWIGYPWGDDADAFLEGVFDRLINDDKI